MNTHQKTMAFWGKYLLTALTLLSIFRVMFLLYHFPESQISINALILGLLNGIRYDLSTIAYILLPIWVIHSIFSQVNIREEVDVSNFPVIEFTIHNRNPNVLSSSNFYFTELVNGQKIESDSFNIEQIKDTIDFLKENWHFFL